MPKDWRTEDLPSVSTQRRTEPEPNQRKAKRNKRTFPPHWEVRYYPWGWSLWPHHIRPEVLPYWTWDHDIHRPDQHDLRAVLAFYALHHPHTAGIPVRFISCQPVECGRQVLD